MLPDIDVERDMDPTLRPGETPAAAADRVRLAAAEFERRVFERYDALPDSPPRFNISENDWSYRFIDPNGPHTVERHDPQISLERSPVQGERTIEGRIYGDDPWQRPGNWSARWIDTSTMQQVVRSHIQENWEDIRSELALTGVYEQNANAGRLIGEGYVNGGLGGVGPRRAEYFRSSMFRLVIRLAPGTDPPEPYIVTAFPVGMMGPR